MPTLYQIKLTLSSAFVRCRIFAKAVPVKQKAYKQLVRPIVEFSSNSWDMLTQIREKHIGGARRWAAHMVHSIYHTDRSTSRSTTLFTSINWEYCSDRRRHRHLVVFRNRYYNSALPETKPTGYNLQAGTASSISFPTSVLRGSIVHGSSKPGMTWRNYYQTPSTSSNVQLLSKSVGSSTRLSPLSCCSSVPIYFYRNENLPWQTSDRNIAI